MIHILGPAGQQMAVATARTAQAIRSVLRNCAETWGLPIYEIWIGMATQVEVPFMLEARPRGWTGRQKWQQRGCPEELYFRLLSVS